MRRTKAEAEETRLKLLEVAEQLFFKKGVASVTLEKIASTAGVTRGAVYWHFANKADLLRALHELIPLPAEDLLARAVADRHEDPLTLLANVIDECLTIIAGDARRQRIYSILFRCDYRGEFLSVLERERETNRSQYNRLVELFELAREKGELNPIWTPQSASRACHWTISGLLFEWLKDTSEFDLVADSADMRAALIQGFRN